MSRERCAPIVPESFLTLPEENESGDVLAASLCCCPGPAAVGSVGGRGAATSHPLGAIHGPWPVHHAGLEKKPALAKVGQDRTVLSGRTNPTICDDVVSKRQLRGLPGRGWTLGARVIET